MYSIHAQQKAKSPGGATPGDFFLDFTADYSSPSSHLQI